MNETLPTLLLRLSEAAATPVLTGRQAGRRFGAEFDRLLACRVLVEQSPTDVWSPCPACECAAGERLVQTASNRLVAACPLDSASDVLLEPDDVRMFEVDRAGVVGEIARASGFACNPEQLLPDAWRLTTPATNEPLLMVIDIVSSAQPWFVPALRSRLDGRSAVLLLPAMMSGAVRLALQDAGFRVLVTAEVLRADWSLALPAPTSGTGHQPRFVIYCAAKRVLFDGQEFRLSDQLFRTLLLLAEAVGKGEGHVEGTAIETHLWGGLCMPESRQVRDIIHDVRQALRAKNLIETRRSPTRFRLALSPDEVVLQD